MTKIKTRGVEVSGDLCGFEETSDSIVFSFNDNQTQFVVKHPDQMMVKTLTALGLKGLARAEIDFRTNKVQMIP